MRILAVDDDPVILALLREVLPSLGYKDVTYANSGHEAYAILKHDSQAFEIMLFDIQMPGLDGITLAKLTRRIPHYSDVPILMLTAMADRSFIDRAFEAGATDYVTKPFEICELRTRMSVAKRLADDQKNLTDKVVLARSTREKVQGIRTIALSDPYTIQDIDRIISLPAFYNYLKQLDRRSMFGSTIIAFSIDHIDRLYNSMTDFEYTCALTDAAEAITSVLPFRQSLMAHSGNGTFVCIADDANAELMEALPGDISNSIDAMDPRYGDGRTLMLSIQVGKPIPLRFRVGQTIKSAILEAIHGVRYKSPTDAPIEKTGY